MGKRNFIVVSQSGEHLGEYEDYCLAYAKCNNHKWWTNYFKTIFGFKTESARVLIKRGDKFFDATRLEDYIAYTKGYV